MAKLKRKHMMAILRPKAISKAVTAKAHIQ